MSKVPEVTPTLLDWHLPAARPYLIADHMSCHFHATAGVGATQDKMVITVFGLAAGVPESQACDGALESLHMFFIECQSHDVVATLWLDQGHK